MKDLVEYLATSLVDNKDAVHVDESESERRIQLSLSVQQDDLGKVIGKKGRTVKAMRILLSALAATHGKQVSLQVLEPEKNEADVNNKSQEDSEESAAQSNAKKSAEKTKEDVRPEAEKKDEYPRSDAKIVQEA